MLVKKAQRIDIECVVRGYLPDPRLRSIPRRGG
jgi:hypothetical protein